MYKISFYTKIGLIGLAFTGCDKTLAVVWLCLSVCFNGAVYSGFQVRFTKIPNFFQNLIISSKKMPELQIQD